MKRPIYQSEVDLEEEHRLATKMVRRLKAKGNKLPPMDHLDAVVLGYNAEVLGWIECKARKTYMLSQLRQMGGLMLSLEKWIAARSRVAGAPGTSLWVVLSTKDGDWYMQVPYGDPHWHDQKVWWRGRADRNDGKDKEPVVLLPIDEFKPLEGSGDPLPDPNTGTDIAPEGEWV